jgi:hypothetical protein
MSADILNTDSPHGFRKGMRAFWHSGMWSKLFILVSFLLILGLIDAGPRYVRAFEAKFSGLSKRPVVLSSEMPQYSLVSYHDDLTRQLEQSIIRVRDSLFGIGLEKADNTPVGFEMLALRPDIQITGGEQPLDSTMVLILLDARMKCDCDQSSNFRLVRFRIDPIDFRVMVLRDQIVSWEAYLSNYRILRS